MKACKLIFLARYFFELKISLNDLCKLLSSWSNSGRKKKNLMDNYKENKIVATQGKRLNLGWTLKI